MKVRQTIPTKWKKEYKNKLRKVIHREPKDRRHRVLSTFESMTSTTTKTKKTVPNHLRSCVENQLNELFNSGQTKKNQIVLKYCFVSPGVKTVKKDQSVQIALVLRK